MIKVWTIDRTTFRKTLALFHRIKREKYMKIFSRVTMLSKLKRGELLALAESVRVVNFSAGQRIAKAGEHMNSFYMVQSGKVRSMPGGDEFEEGQYFGEMALLGYLFINPNI
jgi:signal-transduction protein with cAMP-binding, CBS, and nucleotidyltransferase domain